MKTTQQNIEKIMEESKITNELSVFWEEISDNLPKSQERSALGDEKIFYAFKATYFKIRPYLLQQAIEERNREILGEIEKELQKHIACNKIGGKEIEKGYWVTGFHYGLMWVRELLKLEENKKKRRKK